MNHIKILLTLTTFLIICTTTIIFALLNKNIKEQTKISEPYDQFLISRTYPNAQFDEMAIASNVKNILLQQQLKSGGNYLWQLQGPGNIGGRFNCIATHPTDTNIIYAGAAQGGIFKTTNGGQVWQPIFDAQPFLSIGHIKIDPFNSSKIWVGTGDVNISSNVYTGDGVYLSYNAGNTWVYKGLSNCKIIAQVEVSTADSATIYAAAMGSPFVKDIHRGFYKSTDGGISWTNTLYINDSTGIISFVIDPNNSQILYAAAYSRLRSYGQSLVFSNNSRIWKSIDGGNTWAMQTNGLPMEPLSRINLAISKSGNTTKVYAAVVDTFLDFKDIYSTTNGGNTWLSNSTGTTLPNTGGFGWYFTNIFVDPLNINHLFVAAVGLYESYDGGATYIENTPPWFTYQVHADKHWLSFDADNNMVLATDGGLYKTRDGGVNWYDIENIPVSQFYHVAFDPNTITAPAKYYGGLQDNGTTGGNNLNINAWPRIFGGDGFQPNFEKGNPNIMYAETQYGNLVASTDGGNNFSNINTGINLTDDVKPWDMKYIVSKHNPTDLYAGSDALYKMSGAPLGIFNAIGPVLTKPYFYGKKNNYVTCIAEHPNQQGTLLVGTGDGLLWRCVNELNWQTLSNTLPNRYYTSATISNISKQRYFVTQQGYRFNDNTPHIYMSVDSGINWQSIQGNLPTIGINDLYVFTQNDSFMLTATDAGLYATENQGASWFSITGNIPLCPILDVEVDTIFKKIIVGTYARSMYTIQLDSVFPYIRNLIIPVPHDTIIDTLNAVSSPNYNINKICPNPFSNYIMVSLSAHLGNVKIWNTAGKMVFNSPFQNKTIVQLPNNLKSGVYIVQIQQGDKVTTQKMVRE
jgi:photosystem II stability/assembly factor-like uncharacterized protein